jgi:hypothetical protein
MKCYLDEQTAVWLRRFCSSFSPEVAEQQLRRVCLEALRIDTDGYYVDLHDIDKKLLQPIGVMLAAHALHQTYRTAFMEIARAMFDYAGLSAVEKLAEIVNPKTTSVEGRYDTAKATAIQRFYEREARKRQVAQEKAQNRLQQGGNDDAAFGDA